MARVVELWDNVEQVMIKRFTADARELIRSKDGRYSVNQPAPKSEAVPVSGEPESAPVTIGREEAPVDTLSSREKLKSVLAPPVTAVAAVDVPDPLNADAAPAAPLDPFTDPKPPKSPSASGKPTVAAGASRGGDMGGDNDPLA
jgi:hypothetical protein